MSSWFRERIKKPYSKVQPKVCPICNRTIKNFDAHTRNREDHKALRELHDRIYSERVSEIVNSGLSINPFVLSSINESAWSRAIKMFTTSDNRS